MDDIFILNYKIRKYDLNNGKIHQKHVLYHNICIGCDCYYIINNDTYNNNELKPLRFEYIKYIIKLKNFIYHLILKK